MPTNTSQLPFGFPYETLQASQEKEGEGITVQEMADELNLPVELIHEYCVEMIRWKDVFPMDGPTSYRISTTNRLDLIQLFQLKETNSRPLDTPLDVVYRYKTTR